MGVAGIAFQYGIFINFSLAAQWEESSCLAPLATNLPFASHGFHLCLFLSLPWMLHLFLGGLRLAVF